MNIRAPDPEAAGLLRPAALIALLVGAAGSAALTLRAGERNPSRVLIALFVVWVLSPFAALAFAHVVSRRWALLARARTALYGLMLALTLVSLAVYADVALGPPRAKTAFVFVVLPPASWLIILAVLPMAVALSGKRSRQGSA